MTTLGLGLFAVSSVAFSVQTEPVILHDGIDCIPTNHYPVVQAGIDSFDEVRSAKVYFRSGLYADYYYVGGEEKLPTGTVNIRFHFNFEADAPGGGGTGTIHVNDKQVAEGKIEKTVPFIFSADETLDVGGDLALPVTDDYPEGEKNAFTGNLKWVRVDLEEDNVSHQEPEELKYNRALARQ